MCGESVFRGSGQNFIIGQNLDVSGNFSTIRLKIINDLKKDEKI